MGTSGGNITYAPHRPAHRCGRTTSIHRLLTPLTLTQSVPYSGSATPDYITTDNTFISTSSSTPLKSLYCVPYTYYFPLETKVWDLFWQKVFFVVGPFDISKSIYLMLF